MFQNAIVCDIIQAAFCVPIRAEDQHRVDYSLAWYDLLVTLTLQSYSAIHRLHIKESCFSTTCFCENIKQLLSLKIQCFKAGNISKFYSKWLELTSDPEVLNTVKGQSIGFTTTPYQDQVPAQKNFSKEESNIIQCEINKLLQKEVIKLTCHEPGQFMSTIFFRPKPDGTYRMILNLKKLSESVKYEH